MDLADQLRRGEQAKRLLDDDALSEAFQRVEDEQVQRWKDAFDPADRDEAWAIVRALQEVRQALGAEVQAGLMAAHRLSRLK